MKKTQRKSDEKTEEEQSTWPWRRLPPLTVPATLLLPPPASP